MAARLPLFPLGTVLFPGMPLPLHVFEPRYRQLVADLLDRPPAQREFGVVAIRAGQEVGVGGARSLYEVGCSAHLRQVTPLDGGRYEVLASGRRRFRLAALDKAAGTPYLTGLVDWLPEPGPPATASLAPVVRHLFATYRHLLAGAQTGAAGDGPADATALSYHVAAGMVLTVPDRQRLLAAADAAARLAEERRLLRREIALVRALGAVPGVDLVRSPASPH